MTSVVAFFVLLGVLITVHELGHFLVAKACGVRVLTFSIGFGPRLFGFRRGETDYRVSILPFGGYVRMYGDDATEDVPADQQHYAFLHQPYWKKSAIAVAGPVANIVLPLGLFFALFVGHEEVPGPVVGTLLQGEAAEAAGLLPGDTIVSVNGAPIAVFSDLQSHVRNNGGAPLQLVVTRATPVGMQQLPITVTPRLSPAPQPFDPDAKTPRLGILASVSLPVVVVDKAMSAARAGVKDFDRITAVNGVAVRTKEQLWAALDREPTADVALTLERTPRAAAMPGSAAIGAPIEGAVPAVHTVVVPAEPVDATFTAVLDDLRFAVTAEELTGPVLTTQALTGAALVDVLERGRARRGLYSADGLVVDVKPHTPAAERGIVAGADRIVAVDGALLRTAGDLQNALGQAPDAIHSVGILHAAGTASVLTFRLQKSTERELSGLKVFGVMLADASGEGPLVQRSVSAGEALSRSVHETVEVAINTLRGYGMLLTGRVGIESLGGPITIFRISGKVAALGLQPFVQLMALISLNLALLNLMPIPVLDGGHLLIFTVEAVLRRRLSLAMRARVTMVGLVLVGALMVVAVGNDILSLFEPSH